MIVFSVKFQKLIFFTGSKCSDCSFVTIEKATFDTGYPVESVFNYEVRFWARAYLKMMDEFNQTNKTMVMHSINQICVLSVVSLHYQV